MSRVFTRPTALLDGTPKAARITVPGSDAETYFDDGRVFEKIPRFLGFISILKESGFPRLAGYVKVIRTPTHNIAVVQGEDIANGEEVPVYGFSLSPDGVKEFIGIGRYTGVFGENAQMLAWVDLSDINNPVFRNPNLIGAIEDPSKISELTQIIAVGQDASEWALD